MSEVKHTGSAGGEIAVKVNLRKIGNSLGVLLPKQLMDELGLTTGDELELKLSDPRADERWQSLLALKGIWKSTGEKVSKFERDKSDRVDDL